MRKWYQFGRTTVELSLPEDMPIPANMALFQIPPCQSDKVCILEFSDELDSMQQQFRQSHPQLRELTRFNMLVLTTPEQECRVLRFEGADESYAVSVEESPALTRIRISRGVEPLLAADTVFISTLGLEKIVLRAGALVLHSAYMCRNGEAVLFSAPSGTGKSTQADLWEKYRSTRTVNGDRSLLLRDEDGWYAYGWPVCGSSGICRNERYPVRAIVMLRQAKENVVRRLGLVDSVKKLFAQVTINMWNADFQMRAMDLLQELASEIPVFELECDISENAVECLERVL